MSESVGGHRAKSSELPASWLGACQILGLVSICALSFVGANKRAGLGRGRLMLFLGEF